MNALWSRVSPFIFFFLFSVICVIGTYVTNVVRNKKNNTIRFTKKQRASVKKMVVACMLCFVLLLMQFSIFKDLCDGQTETVVGTLTKVATGTYRDFDVSFFVTTEYGKYRLKCSDGHYLDYYQDLKVGSTYQFEFFIHSKTIKSVVSIDH